MSVGRDALQEATRAYVVLFPPPQTHNRTLPTYPSSPRPPPHPTHHTTAIKSLLLPLFQQVLLLPSTRRPFLPALTMAATAAAAAHAAASSSIPSTPSPRPPRRVLRLALAGDTMLGRCVAETILLARNPPDAPQDEERTTLPFPPPTSQPTPGPDEAVVFAPEVVALVHEASLVFLNLECCITNNHHRWPNPHKPFFFRAPYIAVHELKLLGVDAVTLANNHALDYDVSGLLDTLDALNDAGIAYTGAGRNLAEARQPVILEHGRWRDWRVGVVCLFCQLIHLSIVSSHALGR